MRKTRRFSMLRRLYIGVAKQYGLFHLYRSRYPPFTDWVTASERLTISCDNTQHPVVVRYIPTNHVAVQAISRVWKAKNVSLVNSLFLPETAFCDALSKALRMLQIYRPRDYKWIGDYIRCIQNLPTPEGSNFYSCQHNAIIFDFFRAGYPLENLDEDELWHTVWLSGTLSYFYVQARICHFCPHSLITEPARVNAICLRAAKRLATEVQKQVDGYEFSELF